MTMFIETIPRALATRVRTTGYQLLPIFIALVFGLTICPSRAQAQIVGDLGINIPFEFHVGNVTLPAGQYRIHTLDESDLTGMEITSADGSASALFQVQAIVANPAPAKSVLIFNKYGDRYFLAKLFDAGNPSGSQVLESRDEKKVSQEALEAQAHLAARHRGQ
jgi:hypothetical protein